MKKIFLPALFVMVAFFSHESSAQSNAIKLNILSPIFSTINVSFEHAMSESSSLQLGFFYTGAKVSSLKYSGFGITPEYRIYLSDTPAPAGFYVAPFLRYQAVNLSVEGSSSEADFSAIGGGAVIGKQWVFKQRVTFDIFLGPSYSSGKMKVTSGNEDEFDISGAFDGFGLRTGITLGVAF